MTNYEHIEIAIKYLITHFYEQPSVETLARVSGVNDFHFQQIFFEWVGISPKQFFDYFKIEALKSEIHHSSKSIEATECVGLLSQSGDYDLMVKIEAIASEEYKTFGKGLNMEYGFAESPFGTCFVATTPRGICNFQFVDGDIQELLTTYREEWGAASHIQNDAMAQSVIHNIFIDRSQPLHLHIKGTSFQIEVWEALLFIPSGNVVTYSELAQLVNREKAVRAVASAVARNPVGLIIPCHRVIRKEGVIGQYHWKSERKASIIGWEKAKRDIISL